MSTSNAAEQLPRSQHLLRVLWRGRWWILLPAVLLAALAFAHAAASQKVYQGHATVLISRQNLSTALNNGNATQSFQTGEFLQIQTTQAEIAHSPRVAARVIQQLGLHETPDHLLANVTVAPTRGSDFISFSVNDANKARAQRTAVAFAQQYVAFKRQLDTQSLEQARQSVVAKLSKLNPNNSSDRPVFDDLQSKEQQLQTLEALQSANASAVQTSEDAGAVSPRPLRDTVLGFLLGLVLGVVIVVVRDRVDTRIRRPEDVAEALGMPLLGFIGPPPKRKDGRASGLVMLDSPNSVASEGFRVLALGSAYSSVMVTGKVFMITSAIEAEGKSTTIANLAIAMARTGKRVALVDLDLRRPSLARMCRAADTVGVTDAAVGQASIEEARHSVEIVMSGSTPQGTQAVLDLYPAGRMPPDPGEFVGSLAVRQLLSTLRGRYDIVLVDAPPVLRVGDPLTLAQFVDGIFVVGRIGVIKRSMANELRRLLGQTAIPAVGVIATGNTKWSDSLSYGYGYGYGGNSSYAPDKSRRRLEPLPSTTPTIPDPPSTTPTIPPGPLTPSRSPTTTINPPTPVTWDQRTVPKQRVQRSGVQRSIQATRRFLFGVKTSRRP